MRSLAVVVLLLFASIARADDTLDAGLTLADAMKADADGSQLDDHLAALKVHTTDLAKLHKDHKKEKAINAKLDAAEKAAKETMALGAQAKKVAKNKKLFAAADKKLKAKIVAYASAEYAANKLLDKKADTAAAAPAAAAAAATPEPAAAAAAATAPAVATSSDGASVTSTTCKRIEFVAASTAGKLSIRAVLVDARRKQSRELAANNAPVTKADDYELSFQVKDRKADWKVVDESYEWRETSSKSGATLATSRKSSRDVAKNDTLEAAVSGSGEAVRGKIAANIVWKNGATEETDKEDCAFEIAVTR
jgi:hypothetical protein